MSVWGRRESYRAVALVATAWVVVGTLTTVIRPAIPSGAPDQGQTGAGGSSRERGGQLIHWRTLSADPFIEARQKSRPLFLLIGSRRSLVARSFDTAIAVDSEIAERLNQTFVPVRVDLDRNPVFRNLFLPLSRASAGYDPDSLFVVVRPDGSVVWVQSSAERWTSLGQAAVLSELTTAGKLAAGRRPAPIEAKQAEEAGALLATSGSQAPDIAGYLSRNLGRGKKLASDPRRAGRVCPVYDWTLLEATGNWAELRSQVDTVLSSGLFDWLDGGIYRYSATGDFRAVDFSEDAAQCAMAASILADLAAKTGDEEYLEIARTSFDAATGRFMTDSGLEGASWSDVKPDARSIRQSFTLEELRNTLSQEQGTLANTIWTLDPGRNPQMTPQVTDFAALQGSRPAADALLEKLRGMRMALPLTYVAAGAMDSAATAASSLMLTASRWGDRKRMDAAYGVFASLGLTRTGLDDTDHIPDPEAASNGNLADYAALANACLTKYLVSGDQASLADGESVLKRAIFLFTDNKGRALAGSLPREISGRLNALPDLVDSDVPSGSSLLIQAASAYAVLAAHEADRLFFAELAQKHSGMMAAAANQSDTGLSMYFASVARMEAGTFVLAGPHAVEQAKRLRIATPEVRLLPLEPGVWRDVAAPAPGLYRVSGSKLVRAVS